MDSKKKERFARAFDLANEAGDRGQLRKAFKMFLKSAHEGNVDCYNTV